MPSADSVDPAILSELEAVYAFYAALTQGLDADGLGGKLLYAGELDQPGLRLVRASNIAGAASLSATADQAAQKQAIRDGVIDFLVTSLDEALRILKNEIRKKNAVAVGITLAASQVKSQMLERGVLPDLLRSGSAAESSEFVAQGAQIIDSTLPDSEPRLKVLQSPPAEAQSCLLNSIPESHQAAHRWVRLSPRYLGPQARRLRSVPVSD